MFPLGNLSQDAKIVPILSYSSVSTPRTSEVIDTLGFRNCLILIHHAAVHDSAAATMDLSHSDAVTNETTLSSGADIEGSSLTVSTADNKVQYWDGKPTKRYLQVNINNDDAQVTAQTGMAILYNADSVPTTHGLGTSTVGEGTATAAGEGTFTGWVSGTA